MAQKQERGFAVMDSEEQREIACKGGRAAHDSGHAHEFDSEEAAEAGRKGGEEVSRDREHMAEIGRRGGEEVSRDREHMAEIGRKGGKAAHHRNAAFYHETAAHHHRQAAKHHEAGDEEEGERHGEMAHGHSQTAHGHSQRSRRGFAAMDPEEQREIARKSGRASHGGHDRENEDGDRGENSTRGGTSAQHAEAGRQSHKNR